MNQKDYDKCARRIAEALRLGPGEKVLLKLDPRVFSALLPPLQTVIRASGAHVSGAILAEDTNSGSAAELESIRTLFSNADVFIWLPELHQKNRPALAQALNEWLDAKRGRAVHFHWDSGSYPAGFHELPSQDFIDRMYLAALDVSPEFLALFRRQAELWVELCTLRICMLAVSHTVGPGGIAQALLSLAQVSEPIDDRRTGYAVDEVLVGSWVELGQAVVAEPNSASGVADACFLGWRLRS